MQITVTQVAENRRRKKPKSGENLGFGIHFSDHMFLMDHSQGAGWRDARIVPYGPLSLAPSAMVLHYGQEIFEGMRRTARGTAPSASSVPTGTRRG